MAPQSSAPPSLPPSVEEAYRRKCVQLKNRTNEVEDANDAARLRLARIKRQVEKLRIERAFLLEQLAKRTSTNVEDSEGSPSPPPMPKERPLRTKRGHRKTSNGGEGDDGDAKPSDAKAPGSPGSESIPADGKGRGSPRANGVSKVLKKPVNAFELYCEDQRSILKAKIKDSDLNLEEELARGWKDLPEAEKEEFQAKHDQEMARYREEKEAQQQRKEKEAESQAESHKPELQDEDVEMGNYDTEDPETQDREAEE